MLQLPGDDFVTIELVYRPAKAMLVRAPASTTRLSWLSHAVASASVGEVRAARHAG
jgi:hypothetical protein